MCTVPAWVSIVPLRTFFILANWKTTQIRAWKSHLLFVLKNGSTWASLRHFTVSSVPSQSSFLIVQQKLKIVSIYRAFFCCGLEQSQLVILVVFRGRQCVVSCAVVNTNYTSAKYSGLFHANWEKTLWDLTICAAYVWIFSATIIVATR